MNKKYYTITSGGSIKEISVREWIDGIAYADNGINYSRVFDSIGSAALYKLEQLQKEKQRIEQDIKYTHILYSDAIKAEENRKAFTQSVLKETEKFLKENFDGVRIEIVDNTISIDEKTY
jgi:hypothetical protein